MIPLLASKDLYIIKAKNSTLTPTIKTEKVNSDLSSIKKGAVISKAIITFAENTYDLNLSSGVDYAKSSPLSNPLNKNSKDSTLIMNIIKYFALALAVLIVFMRIKKLRKIKKNKLSRFIDNLNSKR